MFDTMTLTKIVGSLCGALLIFLMGNWAGELLYNTSPGHGDDHHGQAYVIDTGADDHGGEAEAEGPSLAERWAAADVDKGAKVFGKCKACHKLEDGSNATGPYLHGVVGREVSSAAGFSYSGSLKPVVDVWTPETLDAFLENPKGYTPGTSMGFSGLKKAEDRINVIAYLDQTDGDTFELAMPEAMDEAAAEEPAETMTETAAEAVTAEEPTATEVEPTPEAEAAADEATDAATEEAPAEETGTEMAATDAAPAEETAAAGGEASGFAAMVASADPADGEKVYKKCKACHALEDGQNRVGPHLYNLMGRDIASVDGFKYSDALAGLDGNWTADDLSAFLEKPKDYAPGTKMSFAGLRKEDDRAAVIAYIQSASQ